MILIIATEPHTRPGGGARRGAGFFKSQSLREAYSKSTITLWVMPSRAKICPSQVLTILKIMQCLCSNDIPDLVRFDRAYGCRTQYIDHVTAEDLTGPDVTRRPQAATLHDRSVRFILCDEF